MNVDDGSEIASISTLVPGATEISHAEVQSRAATAGEVTRPAPPPANSIVSVTSPPTSSTHSDARPSPARTPQREPLEAQDGSGNAQNLSSDDGEVRHVPGTPPCEQSALARQVRASPPPQAPTHDVATATIESGMRKACVTPA
jgi:hypothetical protein